MTDWKPKFEAGEYVTLKHVYGSILADPTVWVVPAAYVRGDGAFDVLSRDLGPGPLAVPRAHKLSREMFEREAERWTGPPAPSATATKPNYYRFEVRGQTLDVTDVIQGLGLGFEAGNVLKYLARAGRKDVTTHTEDLEKAREYIDRLIAYRTR